MQARKEKGGGGLLTSCINSFAAYGIVIFAIELPDAQDLHHPLYASSPHFSQTCVSNASDETMSRSSKSCVAPYPIKLIVSEPLPNLAHQSRSISPSLSPPSFDLPSVGCLVKLALGPVGLACILS